MGFFNGMFSKPKPVITTKKTYNYLVVAAIQEELSEFYSLTSKLKRHARVAGGAVVLTFEIDKKREIEILTYSSNKMGMPYNAAAIMKIICMHEPIYTFFIGTCAGIKDGQKPGDVLVPHQVFNYESGKHNSTGVFEPDHIGFETDDDIRKYAEVIKNRVNRHYKVIADENFCSGAAVIDNVDKKREIVKHLPRKVTGLDMEAYSLACIQNILKSEGKKIGIIKGIMDHGENKEQSEKSKNKELAITNSAKFALELIKYIEDNILGSGQEIYIQ